MNIKSLCTSKMVKTFSILLVIFIASTSAYATNSENLLINGNLNQDNNKDGWPDGWRKVKRAFSKFEGDNMWLGLEKVKKESGGIVTNQKVELKPNWSVLNLTVDMKVTNVQQGVKKYHTARSLVSFYDANNKRVGDWPKVASKIGTTEWEKISLDYTIPENAKYVLIGFGLWGVGEAECDNFVLTVAGEK